MVLAHDLTLISDKKFPIGQRCKNWTDSGNLNETLYIKYNSIRISIHKEGTSKNRNFIVALFNTRNRTIKHVIIWRHCMNRMREVYNRYEKN